MILSIQVTGCYDCFYLRQIDALMKMLVNKISLVWAMVVGVGPRSGLGRGEGGQGHDKIGSVVIFVFP